MVDREKLARLEKMKKEVRIDEKITADMLLIVHRSGLDKADVNIESLKQRFRLKLNAAVARAVF